MTKKKLIGPGRGGVRAGSGRPRTRENSHRSSVYMGKAYWNAICKFGDTNGSAIEAMFDAYLELKYGDRVTGYYQTMFGTEVRDDNTAVWRVDGDPETEYETRFDALLAAFYADRN